MGVLVAISIPIFTSQLEKAREATDLANIRSAYAELSADALTEEGAVSAKDEGKIKINAATDTDTALTATVTLTQKKAGWTDKSGLSIGGLKLNNEPAEGGGTAMVSVPRDGSQGTVQFSE